MHYKSVDVITTIRPRAGAKSVIPDQFVRIIWPSSAKAPSGQTIRTTGLEWLILPRPSGRIVYICQFRSWSSKSLEAKMLQPTEIALHRSSSVAHLYARLDRGSKPSVNSQDLLAFAWFLLVDFSLAIAIDDATGHARSGAKKYQTRSRKKVSGRRFKTRSVGLVEAEAFFCLALCDKKTVCTVLGISSSGWGFERRLVTVEASIYEAHCCFLRVLHQLLVLALLCVAPPPVVLLEQSQHQPHVLNVKTSVPRPLYSRSLQNVCSDRRLGLHHEQHLYLRSVT